MRGSCARPCLSAIGVVMRSFSRWHARQIVVSCGDVFRFCAHGRFRRTRAGLRGKTGNDSGGHTRHWRGDYGDDSGAGPGRRERGPNAAFEAGRQGRRPSARCQTGRQRCRGAESECRAAAVTDSHGRAVAPRRPQRGQRLQADKDLYLRQGVGRWRSRQLGAVFRRPRRRKNSASSSAFSPGKKCSIGSPSRPIFRWSWMTRPRARSTIATPASTRRPKPSIC